MKLTLFQDETINLDFDCIISIFEKLAPDLKINKGKANFSIKGNIVSSPESYEKLSPDLIHECKNADKVFLFTTKRYDNNYFWEGANGKALISFWGWEHLTNVPLNNGAVFFICAGLIQKLEIGFRHKENTGCINDFWMDKTGVDLGMKAGFICASCLDYNKNDTINKANKFLPQLIAVLRELSKASQDDMDICQYWDLKSTEENFDVFLCHNSRDKDAVRKMNQRLQTENINTWFDEEQLPPGRLWQELLEEQINQIKTAAVFVGESGLGPWQDIELRAFLSEFVRRRCPVIPVILKECRNVPQLPLFLNQFTWVDFRKNIPEPFGRLVWGITGRKN
jgi:hypothetical protein